MRKSVIDPAFEFDSKTWVISVINTGGILNGHSVLLVEGMKRSQGPGMFPPEEKLFVGQYDIFAATLDQPEIKEQKGLCAHLSLINEEVSEGSLGKIKPLLKNQKGVITRIKTFPERLDGDNPGYTRDYSPHLHKARVYYANADKVQIMLESIYHQAAELKDIMERQEYAALPKYQLYGKHHLFTGDPENGINCANWCYEKMILAEVGPRWYELYSKPPKPDPGCKIL